MAAGMGVEEFGMRDYMLNVETRRGVQPEAIQAANRILHDLGIEWFRVAAVEKIEAEDPAERRYRVFVLFDGSDSKTFTVRL
jgi:hypothetical protein